MIPTQYRAKLPCQLSYPVGAGAISQALAGASRVEAFSVSFRDEAVWPGSAFRRLLLERLPYKVMAAEYRPAYKPGIGGSIGSVFDERWELTVYPVLAEFRHTANRLLLTQGLPAIATWLNCSGRAGWIATWQRFELVFNPADGSLASQESRGA